MTETEHEKSDKVCEGSPLCNRMVEALCDHAEWARGNEWETPITLSDDLTFAANLIKKLSIDRDAWKRRAEAAERDINTMLRAHVDDMHCDQCANGENREKCRNYGKDMCIDAEWRGPCAEMDGGTTK